MWNWSPVSCRMNATSSLAKRKSPVSPDPDGRSPRSATRCRMPCALYCASTSAIDAREPPTQEMCGAASMPSARNSSTVASVPSRVEPPAPKVTEQNAGFNCASCRRVARSFSMPSGVRGGKNSRLKSRSGLGVIASIAGRASESIPLPAAAARRGATRSGCRRSRRTPPTRSRRRESRRRRSRPTRTGAR